MKKISITYCTLSVLITVLLYPAYAQWTKIDISSKPMNGVLSLCSHNGILYAGTWSGIQHSIDSGKTWTELYADSSYTPITALYVVDDTCIIAGVHGQSIVRYQHSTAGGWFRADSGLAAESIFAIVSNGHTIFAATLGDGIYRSFDDGMSWSREDTFSQEITATAMIASNDTIFAAVGFSDQNLYRSIDNGAGWSEVYPASTGSSVYSLAHNGSTLFAGCNNGDILRSIDNGINWVTVHNNTSSTGINAFAIKGATVFAGGTSGNGVLCSSDNGDTWTVIDSGLPADITIYSLEIFGTTLFAGTVSKGFWQLPIPDLVTSSSRMQERSAYKNSTVFDAIPAVHSDGTVSFSLSSPDCVKITVTDIAGRESALIVNKRLVPGTYRYRWAADGLSPGCYVVQIRTGNEFVTFKSALVQ